MIAEQFRTNLFSENFTRQVYCYSGTDFSNPKLYLGGEFKRTAMHKWPHSL